MYPGVSIANGGVFHEGALQKIITAKKKRNVTRVSVPVTAAYRYLTSLQKKHRRPRPKRLPRPPAGCAFASRHVIYEGKIRASRTQAPLVFSIQDYHTRCFDLRTDRSRSQSREVQSAFSTKRVKNIAVAYTGLPDTGTWHV